MANETVTSALPITMGDKVIGRIHINPENAYFSGKFDQDLVNILIQSFEGNLLEISFFGRPVNPMDAQVLHEKLHEFINREAPKINSEDSKPYSLLLRGSYREGRYYSILKRGYSEYTIYSTVYIENVGNDLEEARRLMGLLNEEHVRLERIQQIAADFDKLIDGHNVDSK